MSSDDERQQIAAALDATPALVPHLADHAESRKRLTSHSDEIVREHALSTEEMRAIDRDYIERIAFRAEALAVAHPEDADLIRGYVDRQARAAAAWERNAVSASWLLRKG